MTANQEILEALTTLTGQLRDDIREDLRAVKLDLDGRFDAIDARFKHLETWRPGSVRPRECSQEHTQPDKEAAS